MFVQRTGLPKEEIIAGSENEFYSLVNGVKIEFVKNDNGLVDQLIVYQLNRVMPSKRVK